MLQRKPPAWQFPSGSESAETTAGSPSANPGGAEDTDRISQLIFKDRCLRVWMKRIEPGHLGSFSVERVDVGKAAPQNDDIGIK